MKALYLLMIVFGAVIVWSAIKTSVVNGEMWREKAKNREQIERIDPARRGTIYSSDGKVLATTVPVCDLCLDLGRQPVLDKDGNVKRDEKGNVIMGLCVTNKVDDTIGFEKSLDQVCQMLHHQFPAKSVEFYRQRIENEMKKNKPSRCLYVERRVPYSVWDSIRKMPGWKKFVVSKTSEGSVTSFVRAHIYGNMGENTIGIHYRMVDSDKRVKEGYTGLEGYYDSVLRGQDGRYLCRRLTRTSWLAMDKHEGFLLDDDSTLIQRRIDGKSIISTIDTRFQDIAENALRSTMMQYGGERGCAILMEVSTGYVLACSNLTRDTSGGFCERLWSNVACSDKYEPGSTFKTVAMISMLEDKTIGLDTNKRVRAGGKKSYSSSSGIINDGHGYATDTANLPGVLAKSSNIGMCELLWEYYRTRRIDFRKNILNLFPYNRMNPDLDVIQPNTSVVEFRSDRDFLNLSYGYSCDVTPLQMIAFYNAIANNGCMVKPLFCREVLDGSRHSEIKPIVLRDKICSDETRMKVVDMLVGVVEHGTGTCVRNSAYRIAGKTGTALHERDNSLHNSSFAGFFPADNPRYTCLVVVERTSVAGAVVAAPVFKKIADCVMAFDKDLGHVRLQDSCRVLRPVVVKGNRRQIESIHQILGLQLTVTDTTPVTPWLRYDEEHGGYVNYSLPQGVVPNCKGMTIRDAMQLLHTMGLKVRFGGKGKVVRQSPQAHSPIKKGGTVVLELSN